MEQQNNTGVLNDTAGVLPMDTGATINGIHDEGENHPSLSGSAGGKKGRGRPPKSASSTKVSNNSDTPKRARGRPPKTGETPSPIKQVVVPKKQNEEPPTNGDASKRRRGRPSKTGTSNEQSHGISKPQIQSVPVENYEEQENINEPAKKKRGRPFGSSPKKAVVVATPSPSKEVASTKKRGRPSGTSGIKKSTSKPKAVASAEGSAKKRGRPKKSATGTPVANETATVIPINIQ